MIVNGKISIDVDALIGNALDGASIEVEGPNDSVSTYDLSNVRFTDENGDPIDTVEIYVAVDADRSEGMNVARDAVVEAVGELVDVEGGTWST